MKNSYMVSREIVVSGAGITKVITAEPSTVQVIPTGGNVNIYVSSHESPLAELADSIWKPEIIFADVDPDTITRNKGSWIADGFRAGQTLTIANSVSNDGTTYTVDSVTELVLTLDAGDALTDETIAEGSNIVITAELPDSEFTQVETAVGAGLYIYEFGTTAFGFELGTATSAKFIVKS